MESGSEGRSNEDFSKGNQNLSESLRESQIRNDALLAQLESIRISYQDLQSRSMAVENDMILLQQQRDEAQEHNLDLVKAIEEITRERDTLRDELHEVEISSREREDDLIRRNDEESREKLDLRNEVEVSREKITELLEEKSNKIRFFSQRLDSLLSVNGCLSRIIEGIDEEKSESIVEVGEHITDELDLDEESKRFLLESMVVYKLAFMAESKLRAYKETRSKDKRELENSVVSLTEENRDINSLLRIALVEKEAVEKALNRLKGSGEQKRGAILQIAERGLQKVGFGFMMGTSAGDSSDNSGSNTCIKSDSNECEEEVVSLASTVEKIMKNLRLEITQLRRSVEEFRSDTERLQGLTEKQAQKIAENTLYIKELEERENTLAQNVEEFMMEMTGAEEEIARWREACELEVEAGKNVTEERDEVDAILKEELVKTKASLDLSNSKLKLKEELAAAAIAAQAAAEKSLQLADSRAAVFCQRIEELTRQLEEADSRVERSGLRRMRHICWPWQFFRVNPAGTSTRTRNVKRMLPEMEALL
ncbi:hypothetical protein HHK36_032864 [Tetracentron sinense]|uniref:Uncharacterized protein n=1 Tax=Tetracentron sinense TaxID=13715 RepID=A0A834Y9K2_TETSI|nr:hypothetical protein HHK36_032864 [Tetracentron sinense]